MVAMVYAKTRYECLSFKKKAYWRRILSQAEISFREKDRILDAGCGPAGMFIILEQHKVDAVDPLINRYQEKLSVFDSSRYPNVRFHNVSLEAFSTKVVFDKVFCLNVINHVANLPSSMDKLIALTKVGGELLFTVDAHNYQWLKPIFQLIPGDILHPHQYDLQEYKDFISKRGCTITKVKKLKNQGIFSFYLIKATKL